MRAHNLHFTHGRGRPTQNRGRRLETRQIGPQHSEDAGQAASGLESQSRGQFLDPSMTGGRRQSIRVDEEFDVTVDGQPLNTLSGSGKAVANLALRNGLGQVLTNNVLSLFVGDEID